jgi:hypothetical protein
MRVLCGAGPAVMISYSCLSNTLLLTILVAILSKCVIEPFPCGSKLCLSTFNNISSDPASEGMYRRAVTSALYVPARALPWVDPLA